MSAKEIPVEHLDYGYIEKCSDIKYLTQILEVLRSGEEGFYPHLIQFCENHLKKLDPQNRALIKDNPVTTSASLPEDEWSQINEDIMVWEEDTKHIEISLKQKLFNDIQDENMPPVRCSQISHPKEKQNFSKLAVPNEENIDTTAIINTGHPKIKTKVDVTSLSDQEKVFMANREKEKGNEAFKANDYEEAAAYYSRSLSILPTVAALNNRTLAEIKQKHWHSAMKDCQRVLELEPRNIKALLRCAMVHKQLGSFQMAADDLRIVLQEEPLNTAAIKLMTEIKACYPELNKTKGRTILIQDIDDEEGGGSKDAMKAEQDARPVEPRQPVGGEESAASCAEKENMGNAQKRPHHGRGEGSPHSESNNSHGHRRNRGGSSDKYKLAQESPDKVANGTAKMDSTASNHPASQGSDSRGAPVAGSGGETVNLDAPCRALPPPLARLKNEGNLLFKNGQFADAVEKYSQAITDLTDSGIDSPEDLCILYSNRAACRLKDGNSQDCIDDCTRALELQPFSLKPLLRRAMAYETLERYSKAYVDYKTVLQIDISVQAASDSVNRITKLLIQQDGPDWREHLPHIPVVPLCAQQHRREEPPSAEVLQARAEKTARDAERKAEARFSTLKQEGNDLVKKGQYQDALGKYSECLKLKHEECAIYTNRALCYVKLEMFAEAKQDCDTALRLEPTNKKAFYRRAMANKGLKDYLACTYDLQEVLQQDPNVQEAEKELEEVTSLLRLHSLANTSSTGKPRKVVPITEVDGDEETGPLSTSETNGRAENFPINLQPTNAYEFGQALNAARSTGNTVACACLLSSISPDTLPQYLSTQLDGNNIGFIMQALDSHLLKRDPNLVYHHLKHLHTADRFSVAWMLLEEEERGHVTEMFEHLSAVESTEFTKNDVQYLANKYI